MIKRMLLTVVLGVLLIIFGSVVACPTADISGDCVVNLEDFAIMASQWLDDERVEVPDVVNMSQSAAEAAIEDPNLVVGTITQEFNDTISIGNVISQNPLAGQLVPTESTVDFVVSLGPGEEAPDVVGMVQSSAEVIITYFDFTVGTITHAFSSTVDANDVISQNPPAGELLPPGGTIDLVISLGSGVVAPDVVDMSQSAAETAITDEGLTVGAITEDFSSTISAGNVISQNPLAGEVLSTGGAVDLVISLGAGVAVPDVVDMTLSVAQTAITDVGLSVGEITQQHSRCQ